MSDETKTEIPQDLSQFLPTTKTPNKDVISALWAYVLAQVEKAQSISAEARERVTNQSELAGLNRKAFNTVMSAIRKGKKHQFEAIEDLKHTMLLCMWGIEEIQKQGHTGDIAEMAAKSAEQPQGSKPAEPKPAGAQAGGQQRRPAAEDEDPQGGQGCQGAQGSEGCQAHRQRPCSERTA